MTMSNGLCDRQSQTRTPHSVRSGFVSTPEAIENKRELFALNANTRILNIDKGKTTVFSQSQHNSTFRKRILEGIL
jgi:hypothetical protein